MAKKLFELSPGMGRITEVTFENMENLPRLIKGLQFLAWEYLSENINDGVDDRINGAFIRDFCDLLEYLLTIDEELKAGISR
jgi:hypothetical protein